MKIGQACGIAAYSVCLLQLPQRIGFARFHQRAFFCLSSLQPSKTSLTGAERCRKSLTIRLHLALYLAR
jgi:hypothetical protein